MAIEQPDPSNDVGLSSSAHEESTARVSLPAHPALAPILAVCKSSSDVLGVVLLGSTARGEALARSDLDIGIVARAGRRDAAAAALEEALRPTFVARARSPAKRKIILFSSDVRRKVDLFVVEDIKEIALYVASSRTPSPESAVLLDSEGSILPAIRSIAPECDDLDVLVDEHLTRFASAFESASSHHSRGDMYAAQFHLHIAIQSAAALSWLASGKRGFLWAPPRLLRTLDPDLRDRFSSLTLGLDANEFYERKQQVFDLASDVLRRLHRLDDDRLHLCAEILERDRFWHFRDAATFSDERLATGVLFRGSSPGRFERDPRLAAWFRDRHISVRVDLRAPNERLEHPVGDFEVRTVEAPVDPWNHFANDDVLRAGVDRAEASYRFTAFRCTYALRAVIEMIARDDGGVFVHCHAGRDRTGVIVALAQRLAGADLQAVLAGYSASSDATGTAMLSRVLALVERMGGVERLALESGVTPETLAAFRNRMRHA